MGLGGSVWDNNLHAHIQITRPQQTGDRMNRGRLGDLARDSWSSGLAPKHLPSQNRRKLARCPAKKRSGATWPALSASRTRGATGKSTTGDPRRLISGVLWTSGAHRFGGANRGSRAPGSTRTPDLEARVARYVVRRISIGENYEEGSRFGAPVGASTLWLIGKILPHEFAVDAKNLPK